MTPEPPAGFSPYADPGEFIELVGPVYARHEGEVPVFGLRVEDRHRNLGGAAHGGLLAALVDFAVGRAVAATRDDDGGAVTVSLTTHYLAPAKPGDWVEAHTEVDQLGSTLAFADCSLRVGDREVVRARAVFAVVS